MQQSIVALTQKLYPDAEVSTLKDAQILLRINWRIVRNTMVLAAKATAHERYQEWYHNVLRRKRRHPGDDDYVDENLVVQVEPDNPDASHTDTISSVAHSAVPVRKSRRHK